MRKNTLLFLSILLATFVVSGLFASKIQVGKEVIITKDTQENLYLAGGDVTVKSTISKDIFGAGGNIMIMDSVMQDILFAGGDIKIDGVVSGDIRVFGGKITINNHILGDLVIAGGTADIGKNAVIYGDLIVAGGTVTFHGTIKGKSTLSGGKIAFHGTAEGPLEVKSSEVGAHGTFLSTTSFSTNEFVLGPAAQFSGDVKYYNKSGEIDFGSALLGGATAELDPDLKPEFAQFGAEDFKGAFWYILLFRVLSSALLILIAVWTLGNFFEDVSMDIRGNILNDLGLGLLYFVLIPIITILAFITVIGIPIGMIFTTGYGLSIMLAHVITSVLAVYFLEEYTYQNWRNGQIMVRSIGVYLVMKLISFIPVIGNVFNALIVMVAFGAIIYTIKKNIKSRNSQVSDRDTHREYTEIL